MNKFKGKSDELRNTTAVLKAVSVLTNCLSRKGPFGNGVSLTNAYNTYRWVVFTIGLLAQELEAAQETIRQQNEVSVRHQQALQVFYSLPLTRGSSDIMCVVAVAQYAGYLMRCAELPRGSRTLGQ